MAYGINISKIQMENLSIENVRQFLQGFCISHFPVTLHKQWLLVSVDVKDDCMLGNIILALEVWLSALTTTTSVTITPDFPICNNFHADIFMLFSLLI